MAPTPLPPTTTFSSFPASYSVSFLVVVLLLSYWASFFFFSHLVERDNFCSKSRQGGEGRRPEVQRSSLSCCSWSPRPSSRPSLDEMAHKGVPKFGSWEDEDQGDHLYTQYFENARKDKSPGRSVNQNDHNGEKEAVSKDPPSIKASPLRTGLDPGVRKPKDERHASREDDLRRHEATARKPHAESPNHIYGDHTNYDSAAKKTSMERSPIHPRHQARIANKGGVSSPSWDRRGSSEGNRGTAPTTPGRSKNRSSGHGDETPERGSAVPKFGEWDEKDPSTGEGFTDIFDNVRKEKQSGNAPVNTGDADYMNRSNQGRKYESSGCSCFRWFKN